MVAKFDYCDVAVVKVEFSRRGDENGFNYAIFGDGNLFRGQEVINIGHLRKWVYTSVRGEICFPCVNDVRINYNDRRSGMFLSTKRFVPLGLRHLPIERWPMLLIGILKG